MATKHSSGTNKRASVRPKSEERVRVTDHSDPPAFDKKAQATVRNTVHALYIIRRLAIAAINEPIAGECGDAATFCYAIQQMSLLHGKDLDECVGRVTGSSAGYFDEEDEAEREGVPHG